MSTPNTAHDPERDDDATTVLPTGYESTGPGTTPGDAPPTATRDPLRVGTIVWGLIVALIGTGILAWGQGLRFDVQLAAIGVLAAAGVLLVVSSLVRTRQRSG